MADRLEGVARAWQGDEAGVELIRAAMQEAAELGATWLLATSRAFLDLRDPRPPHPRIPRWPVAVRDR